MRSRAFLPLLVLLAAGCHRDEVTIRGTFRDAAPSTDSTLTVWAVEAQRAAPVHGGAFELNDLVAGPATLEVRAGGHPIGRIEVPDLPVGGSVTLQGLRIDRASARAFPADVELKGAHVVTVNGVRMAPSGDLPGDVDARGTVLAMADDGDALMLRPDDASMPDLRVVLVPATRTATRDGAPAQVDALAAGDSVRVKGSTHAGYVIASALEVPASRGAVPGPGTEAGTGAGGGR